MKTKVSISSVRIILSGCGVFQKKVKQMFLDKGIDPDNPDGDQWVDLESLSSVLFELERTVGKNLLIEIGRNNPTVIGLPPELDTFDKALKALDFAYKMEHKVGDTSIGSYKAVDEGPNKIRLICDTPAYPANFNFGLIKGFASVSDIFIEIEEVHMNDGGEFIVKY